MPHYHTEGFKNDWKLVRETASSQKFRVTTPDEIATYARRRSEGAADKYQEGGVG